MPNGFLSTRHRPWPLPDRPWMMRMGWDDLAFLHWPVPAACIRPHLPAGLEVDQYDGQSWIGIVPFRMARTRLRFLPPFPTTGTFPELNVRTYVTCDGRPGVWFFSLDAPSALAVATARRLFHLPYVLASITLSQAGDTLHCTSRRRARPVSFEARYRPTGPPVDAAPGTLGHWLIERYCLYAADRRGRLYRGDVHHAPWPIQPAEVEIQANTLTGPLALPLPDRPPLCHFARRLDVRAWRPLRVSC